MAGAGSEGDYAIWTNRRIVLLKSPSGYRTLRDEGISCRNCDCSLLLSSAGSASLLWLVSTLKPVW